MGAEAAAFCTGCGLEKGACPGDCRRALDPPRFCPRCGTRLFAQVTPQGYRANCKKHGAFDLADLEDSPT